MLELTRTQREIAEAALDAHIFVHGRAGCGKTTAGAHRLESMIARDVPANSILVLAPQRSLHEPYLEILSTSDRGAGGEIAALTIGGLARRMCDLFWPLAAGHAGFAQSERAPLFLTLETAQYYMAFLVRPLLEQGYFEAVTIDRNRLYAQIIDNLNKAAVVGFDQSEIGARLDSAWLGDPAQRRIYQDVQDCASRFRAFCLQNNLLDFSLQMEVFANHLWPLAQVREYLNTNYRHLIYDNLEEDTPRAHDLIRAWLPDFDSALLILDDDAGFRQFLGGDARSGTALQDIFQANISLDESFVQSDEMQQLSHGLLSVIERADNMTASASSRDAFEILRARYYPEMLDKVVDATKTLLVEHAANEIVIISPYLSDALRFELSDRLKAAGIAFRSTRPSRSLRHEPASQTLLTLAAIAHPHWNAHPPKSDVAQAFSFALSTDLIRAQLLTEIVYHQKDVRLYPFDQIRAAMQERVTFALGEKYSALREWIESYRVASPLPLDFFLRKLFGELLSQTGFGFHANLDAVRVASNLIESIKKFRYAMEPSLVGLDSPAFDLGREYLTMLNEGVLAAQYLESWRDEEADAVLIAPAHSFLMLNHPVTFQFWLDPGAGAWIERVAQPLTHPYVLSREWPLGKLWTDADEVREETEALARLVAGLLSRCRQKIFLALSDLGETGFEQRGVLLHAFQGVLQARES